MALELTPEQADRLAKISTSGQGNRTTHNRRKPMIEPWQILKAREMLSADKTFDQIMTTCDISIYKLRRIKQGLYDHVLEN